jgi:large subunit ribosomal protein L10
MPSTDKVEKVKEIKERLEAAEGALFADYRGLSVQEIGEVRTALIDARAQLAVVKNTLARLAVRDAGMEGLEAFLEGPTAIAFLRGDPAAGAKAVVDAAKRFPVLEVKGGLAEGRILSADQIRELASLDSREEMLAKVAGMLGVTPSRAAYAFGALQATFLRLLEAYREKLPAEEPAAVEESEPSAEETSVAESAAAEEEKSEDRTSEEQDEQEEGA